MTVKTFAAIDVGSFELELGIFEISASAGIREIDHVRHALALGKDTYNDGRLSHEIVEEMCEVLNKFREVMKHTGYRITGHLRAVRFGRRGTARWYWTGFWCVPDSGSAR